jgi:hypothetical protein
MKRKQIYPRTYTLLDVMSASPTEPTPAPKRLHQLTRMYAGLRAIEQEDAPATDDWRVCSDAVNLMETLVTQRHVDDGSGLLMDAITALALAGRRHVAGGAIRLDGPGILAVRSVLEDYAAALEQLPHRTMVACHRETERRIAEIHAGHRRPHDVEVMAI